MPEIRSPRASSSTKLLAAFAVVAALYFAREVLIPFALALLLSFLLAPLVARLQRLGLRRFVAVVIAVALGLVFIVGVGWLVAAQAADLAQNLPEYRRNIVAKFRNLNTSVSSSMGTMSDTVEDITREILQQPEPEPVAPVPPSDPLLTRLEQEEEPPIPQLDEQDGETPIEDAIDEETVKVEVVEPKRNLISFISTTLGPVVHPLASGGIAIVFVFFILLQRDDLRDRLIRVMGHGRMNVTTEALNETASRVSKYLLMMAMVNGANGAIIAIGLAFIGVPSPLLWGFLAAILRFVPFLGPVIAAVLPAAMSVAVFDTWTPTLLTIGLFIVADVFIVNLIEPWVYGLGVGASPIAILVSAVFWTWLWGPVGLLLATPIAVCLVVIGKYFPQLEFLHILMGSEPALETDVRFYHRLLAMDAPAAERIATAAGAEAPLATVYDAIIAPALARAEYDRERGFLEEERKSMMVDCAADIVEHLRPLSEHAGSIEPEGDGSVAPVLCIPARDEADELAATMLVHLLEAGGVRARRTSMRTLTSELVQAMKDQETTMACICALSAGSALRARYLCKKLSMTLPDLAIVVGVWSIRGETDAIGARLECGPNVESSDSLAAARDFIVQRMTTLAPPSRKEVLAPDLP